MLTFYYSYHMDQLNQVIHMVFIPAILWTALIWLCYTPPVCARRARGTPRPRVQLGRRHDARSQPSPILPLALPHARAPACSPSRGETRP